MSIECFQKIVKPSKMCAIAVTTSDMMHIKHHCQRVYPLEGCGLLVGHRDGSQVSVNRVVSGTNIAVGDRSRQYQIDWPTLFNTIRQARTSGETIVGFYHSHPDCEPAPSNTDRIAAWLDYVYLIVPVHLGVAEQATAWYVSDPNVAFESIAIE